MTATTAAAMAAHLLDGEDEVGRDEGEDGHVEGDRVPHGLQPLLHPREARLARVLPPPPLRQRRDALDQPTRVVADQKLFAAFVELAVVVPADKEVVGLAVVEAARRGGDAQERRVKVLSRTLSRGSGERQSETVDV